MKSVENILKQRDAFGATFFDIGEHTPISGIRRGIQAFKDAGADVIVSVGGGSPIDASKAILHNIQQESGGSFFKQIAVPTTLSAAEYTVSAMYWAGGRMGGSFLWQYGAGYTGEDGHKVGISSQAPAGIILDAELTLATPERLW